MGADRSPQAINAGLGRFIYRGWRMHIDADIALPDNFRRVLFNHTTLDKASLYGCDRVDVIGLKELAAARDARQHNYGCLVYTSNDKPAGARLVHRLHGYCPIGFFQLWHADYQPGHYPWSRGTAEHDDVQFAMLWPEAKRHHLPSTVVYHVLAAAPTGMGENWSGRKQPRLS